MLELRSQLQEKRGALLRQVEEERRRVASWEQESAQVHYNYNIHNFNIANKDGARSFVS